jgi:hypothetical protein
VKYSKEEKETARERLSFLKPGDVVYTQINSVSRSGMTRWIKPIVIVDNEPQWIGYHVAALLDEPLDKNGGVKMTGCGMDMGFHLVYNLGWCLFPDGFKVEGRGRNGDMSGWDNDGGYALKQRWL